VRLDAPVSFQQQSFAKVPGICRNDASWHEAAPGQRSDPQAGADRPLAPFTPRRFRAISGA